MPSILNLVQDLDSGAIVGIGAKPPSHQETGSAVLSGTCFVQYSYVNIRAELSASNRLSCVPATSIDINGTYLHFKDNTSTVTRMDILRPIVVSGNFSGCAYKVFREGGILYCAHIARPGGTVGQQNANLNLMDNYAQQKGWEEIQHIPTAGHVNNANGCREVVIVSQLKPNSVDSVLLEVNNMGLIVATQRFTSPL